MSSRGFAYVCAPRTRCRRARRLCLRLTIPRTSGSPRTRWRSVTGLAVDIRDIVVTYRPFRRGAVSPRAYDGRMITTATAKKAVRLAAGAGRETYLVGATLVASAIVSALIAARDLDPATRLAFAGALACVVISVVVAVAATYRRFSGSPWYVLASPLAIAAATWLVLFVYRPLDLYAAP